MPTYTYQFGANPVIDQPRFLVADTDMTAPIFADEEIMMAYQIASFPVFVSPGGVAAPVSYTPSVRFVAASLLDSLAGNASRLGGMLQALDIKLDTKGVAADLRETAQALREAEWNSGAFGIAEMAPNSFSQRERFMKQILRIQA